MDASIQARAPGKLFLSGEYSVLDGGPAIVSAVDRYVNVEFLQDEIDEQPQARRWRDAARGVLCRHGCDPAPADRPVSIDSRALYSHDGRKYGLGSSAAVAVGMTGLLLSASGGLPGKDVQLRIAAALHRAHRGPGGSGVDVTASLYGGIIGVGDGRTEGLQWPEDLAWVVIWSGRPADTANAVGRYRSAAKAGKGSVGPARVRLREAAESVRATWNCAAPELLGALEQQAAALQELDRTARLGIYTAPHRQLRDLAGAAGCVYKPSGAGGGDCGMAFACDSSRIEALCGSVRSAGYSPLELRLAARGMMVHSRAG